MARVMTPDEIIKALKKWQVPFAPEDGWRDRGRPESLGWGTVFGFVNHHTATSKDVSAAATNRLLRVGRSDLPGPLSQFATQRDGTVALIAAGRANHAGSIRREVLDDLLADRHVSRPSTTANEVIDGNAILYGNEVHTNGTGERHPDEQLRSIVLLNAAILDHHDWSHNSATQHKQITARKVDMADIRGEDSDVWVRREVKRALALGPGNYRLPWEEPAPVDPVPALVDTTEEENSMILIISPSGSGYHLTSKGLIWLPADVRAGLSGPVTTVPTSEVEWEKYKSVFPIVKPVD